MRKAKLNKLQKIFEANDINISKHGNSYFDKLNNLNILDYEILDYEMTNDNKFCKVGIQISLGGLWMNQSNNPKFDLFIPKFKLQSLT